MTKNSNRESVHVGDVVAARGIIGKGTIKGAAVVTLADLRASTEASADATARTPEEIGALPYEITVPHPSADPAPIEALADDAPITDTPKNGDTDGTDPHAG